jgi:hypothetical protein
MVNALSTCFDNKGNGQWDYTVITAGALLGLNNLINTYVKDIKAPKVCVLMGKEQFSKTCLLFEQAAYSEFGETMYNCSKTNHVLIAVGLIMDEMLPGLVEDDPDKFYLEVVPMVEN